MFDYGLTTHLHYHSKMCIIYVRICMVFYIVYCVLVVRYNVDLCCVSFSGAGDDAVCSGCVRAGVQSVYRQRALDTRI